MQEQSGISRVAVYPCSNMKRNTFSRLVLETPQAFSLIQVGMKEVVGSGFLILGAGGAAFFVVFEVECFRFMGNENEKKEMIC